MAVGTEGSWCIAALELVQGMPGSTLPYHTVAVTLSNKKTFEL